MHKKLQNWREPERDSDESEGVPFTRVMKNEDVDFSKLDEESRRRLAVLQ